MGYPDIAEWFLIIFDILWNYGFGSQYPHLKSSGSMLNRQLSNFYMILHPKNHSNSIWAKSYDIFLNGMLMTCYQKRYTQLASLNSIGIVWTILLKRRWFRCRNRCISLLSRSRTNLKPVFSSSWQKTDPKKQGGSIEMMILEIFKKSFFFHTIVDFWG